MSKLSLLLRRLTSALPIILLLIFVSCKKSKIEEPQTVFSFKANGVFFKWSNNNSTTTEPQGAILSKLSTATGNTYYVLEGLDHSTDTFLNLAMFANTLQATTYSTVTTDPNIIFYSSYKVSNVFWLPLNTSDSVRVTITDIIKNFANGNFSAVMHDPSTRAKVEITDGSFQHVMIVQ